ncbi:NAD+ synthase [Candidatus Nitrosocosmicus sp. SS]|jgi:NAD+ synthase|uniref:NAD+ synthase n=1 Tax=Candidatus Nitrosocosmicus agrestis TaxID=2563600 RepID=UPI00122E1AD8|nr:NAD+ synthase [Candidatus Nitrosocosmicus sp. SS]KAA2282791.1 NAD+ synthase [Candidatus Nitrosocosmicus sp. SS]KAF0870275.1 NAD+ synthase [Candidatus Nitrosocosmicus sp. SS]
MNEALIFDKISKFLLHEVKERNANCVVIGISGGIDSTVAAFVAAKSLGPKKVLGLMIPDYSVTPKVDVKDGIEISKQLGINYKLIDITKGKKILLKGFPNNRLARGNFLVRLRMSILYYYAAAKSGLVLGTADKSELQLGYFTKHGDGGADIFPIADLYKTEIREFAKYLGVPSRIIEKVSSARIWKGQTAEGEIGVNYETIDKILKNIPVDSISIKSKLPKIQNVKDKEIRLVVEWIESNRHKHELELPICKLS